MDKIAKNTLQIDFMSVNINSTNRLLVFCLDLIDLLSICGGG